MDSHPAPDHPAAPGPRSTPQLLADRRFGAFFAGNLLSNSGNWLYNVTAAVVVYDLTGSALLVGMVSVAQYASLVGLSPIAGALGDRTDRRRLLIAAQSLSAACATALAVAAVALGVDGLPGAWPVLAATAGIGVGVAFSVPTLQALVPALVPDADLETAVSLTSLTFNVGRALGPAVAGILLATAGAEAAFAVNAVSFVALIGVLVVIRPRAMPRDADADRSVRAGLTFARHDRGVLALLAGVGAVGFATDPVSTLTPALAASLGGGDGLVAFLVSSFGVGAAAGALLSGRAQRRAGAERAGRAGCGVMAAGLLGAALAPGEGVALAALAVTGGGFLVGLTSYTALLLRRIPDHLRGRVMALWSVAFLGTRPLAALVDGAAADAVGPRPALAIAVVVALTGAIVTRRAGVEAPAA